MTFDIKTARTEADYFLEYPDELDRRWKKFAMTMRAACNRIEELERGHEVLNATLATATDETDRWVARAKLAEARLQNLRSEQDSRFRRLSDAVLSVIELDRALASADTASYRKLEMLPGDSVMVADLLRGLGLPIGNYP